MVKDILTFFSRIFSSPEIRKRIIFTAGILVIFRIAAHVPAGGIDKSSLESLFLGSPLLSLLDVFSGGTLVNFSVLALGLGPYITASIVMQLATFAVPSLEELSKEGEYGREKINQYTRFLTLPIASVQAMAMYTLLRSQGIIGTLDPIALISLVLTMVAGTMLALWLGELITEYGLGNGVSFLIFAGIVGRLPVVIGQSLLTLQQEDVLKLGIFLVIALFIIGLIVFITEATYQIPVNFARRGATAYATGTHLPLRLNQAGVIPIIFAISLVFFPFQIAQFLSSSSDPRILQVAAFINDYFTPQSLIYNLVYFFMVFGFTFFYTSVVFNPEKISEDLQKRGGFIPGVRPGSQTAKHLSYVLNRITPVGALFLGFIAVLPSVFQNAIGISTLAIGGTGVLIAVSVILELTRDLEGRLVMKQYKGLLRKQG